MQVRRTKRGVTVRLALAEAETLCAVFSGASGDTRLVSELTDRMLRAIKEVGRKESAQIED